ncbi:MAG: SDR family oxidoreductase [Pseudomonadales bacterium]|jgi:(3R)-3-hydroxyacyl-CoA dehydrogenase / 3a,7a,12a-trihydroxy-5b-cholest-24-enoyl-CoA hydratase / enoyl-CoA hydratase 2|nr:SDR family oxidoreductase [Pseudomonadales bacterium]
MALTFENKVAVVTGSGNGLGRSHALLLGSLGAQVVVNDLGGATDGSGTDDTVADGVVAEIKASGGEAVANPDSVTDGDKIIQCAMDTFGRVDIVINNAGILRDKSFHKMSDDDWDLVYNVHLKGAYKVSRAAFPYMREQGFGRFVMTTSAAGIYGNFGQANYSACKLALHGLSQTIAIEGRAKGIQSNTIAPLAASRLLGSVMTEAQMAMLNPALVSPLVVYLSHDSCESTGGLFEVGAGWISRVRWERSQGEYFNPKGFDVDDVADAFDKISDFTDAQHPDTVAYAMKAIRQNPMLGEE